VGACRGPVLGMPLSQTPGPSGHQKKIWNATTARKGLGVLICVKGREVLRGACINSLNGSKRVQKVRHFPKLGGGKRKRTPSLTSPLFQKGGEPGA